MKNLAYKKFLPYLIVTRPLNLVIIAAAVYLGFAVTSNAFVPSVRQTILFVPIILLAAAGYCINDVLDMKEDKINKPDRVLVRKAVSKKTCTIYALVLTAFSVAISLHDMTLAVVNTTLIVFVLAYNFFLKKTPLAGNFTTAILSSFPVIWGSYIGGTVNLDIIYIAVLAFILHFTREIVKDIEDIKGDSLAGKNTTAVFFGAKISVLLASFLILLSCVMAIFVFTYLFRISVCSTFSSAIVTLSLMFSLFALLRAKFPIASKSIRISMILCVFCLFFLYL
ncbi:UbiA family prenyltransferase [candidate division WOR-3 bacterium]|nr:UbiA family prenyltransferase [candidate division WOR-3 bacterium]